MKLQLAGRKYDSDSIIGKRYEDPGGEEGGYVAVYSAKIDGAHVIVNCVVAGTPEHPKIVKLRVRKP